MRTLLVVHPHGFCSGVKRAVTAAEELLRCFTDQPVYCLHEIVHNQHVVNQLKATGMVFVKDVSQVPPGSVLLLSAHGVAPAVRQHAAERNLRIFDATCPFVSRIHAEVRCFAADNIKVICIGHRKHDEVIGVAGEAPEHVFVVESALEAEQLELPADQEVAVVMQTTLGEMQIQPVLSVLKRRFPQLRVPASADVCYATRNRQQAVKELAKKSDLILVLGAENSSNTQRLKETAEQAGCRAILISRVEDLSGLDFSNPMVVGITSGASTPEFFLEEVVQLLCGKYGFQPPENYEAIQEDAPVFRLPKCLSQLLP